MIYVTEQDVIDAIGSAWTGTQDAIDQTNEWLTVKLGNAEYDPVPAEITKAGVLLAQEAAAGRLYADQERELTSKTVKAGSVSSTKEWREGSQAVSGVMQRINALLSAYVTPFGGSVTMMRRI